MICCGLPPKPCRATSTGVFFSLVYLEGTNRAYSISLPASLKSYVFFWIRELGGPMGCFCPGSWAETRVARLRTRRAVPTRGTRRVLLDNRIAEPPVKQGLASRGPSFQKRPNSSPPSLEDSPRPDDPVTC